MGTAKGGKRVLKTQTITGTGLALAIGLLAETAGAQSSIRPIPRAAQPSAGGALHSVPLASWSQLDSVTPEEEDPIFVHAELSGRALGTGEFSDLPGQVQTLRGTLSATLGREFGPSDRAAIELRSESSFYDFSSSAELIPGSGDPANDLYDTRLIGSHDHALSANSSLFTGLEFRFAGEDEASLTDGLTLAGAVGYGYRPSPELEVRFGALAFSRLEDDAVAIPFVGIDWQPNDRLRLTAEGTRAELELGVTQTIDMTFGAEYAQRQYRLNDTGTGAKGSAFRDEQVDAELEVGIQLGDNARLTGLGGVTLWRELTFLSDGALQSVTEIDPQPYVGLGLTLSF